MTRAFIPDEILALAHERARAREARDWAEADRLRAAIETAGWRIVDRGTDFALTPAAPPDLVEGEQVRYGASRNVPSRLEERAGGPCHDRPDRDGLAGRPGAERSPGCAPRAPAGTSLVIVADAPSDGSGGGARGAARRPSTEPAARDPLDQRAAGPRGGDQCRDPARERADRHRPRHERRAARATSSRRSSRRSRTRTSASPVRGASSRATCASSRTRRRVTSTPSRVRHGLSARGLRRTRTARRAVPLLPEPRHLVEPRAPGRRGRRRRRGAPSASRDCRSSRHEHRGWTSLPDEERDRQSKRNFYRIIDRFGARRDLLTRPG